MKLLTGSRFANSRNIHADNPGQLPTYLSFGKMTFINSRTVKDLGGQGGQRNRRLIGTSH